MKILTLILISISIVWTKPNHEARIIGGDVARGGQFPFAAAIYVSRPGGTFFCAGALLTNQWILTAGQCVVNAVSFIIQLGSNSLTAADANRVTLATATYEIHPNYDPETLQNDIGLIKLRLPIEFNQYIGAITLPSSFIPDYTSVTAIGWGQLGDFSTGLSENLTFVTVTTISHDECQLTFGGQITMDMICVAGNFNEGICNGDMGGALVQTIGGNAVHVGIASFISNSGCESTDPSGFTRTIPYLEWIRNVTET